MPSYFCASPKGIPMSWVWPFSFCCETPCSFYSDLDFDLDANMALDLDYCHSLQNKLLHIQHLSSCHALCASRSTSKSRSRSRD